jgi:nucleoside-diphosphate-sugar epimerase
MRTLVIGGTRNLGPGLIQALLARGDDVTILNRGVTPDDLPLEVRRLTADRSDDAALRAELRAGKTSASGAASTTDAGAGRAGTTGTGAGRGGGDYDLVVDTTLYTGHEAKIITALLAGRVGRYVWWSTGQVYLVRAGLTRPFRESDYDGPLLPEPAPPATLDHRNWLYGIGKRDAEDTLTTAFREREFPAVSLRMPMIASERDHYTRIAAYVRRLLDGGPILIPEDPPLPVRHVYGGDVIRATLRAAAAPGVNGHAFNVSQDETLEFFDVIARIGQLLGRTPRYATQPRARLEELGLLPTCSPFSDPWMSSLANDLSQLALGMTYTPVDEYLPRCVEAAVRLPIDRVIGYGDRELELSVIQGGSGG